MDIKMSRSLRTILELVRIWKKIFYFGGEKCRYWLKATRLICILNILTRGPWQWRGSLNSIFCYLFLSTNHLSSIPRDSTFHIQLLSLISFCLQYWELTFSDYWWWLLTCDCPSYNILWITSIDWIILSDLFMRVLCPIAHQKSIRVTNTCNE